MSNSKDYYKILGLSPGATQEEIKKAYHNLAQKYHADKVIHLKDPQLRETAKELFEEKMKEINEAYYILTKGGGKDIYSADKGEREEDKLYQQIYSRYFRQKEYESFQQSYLRYKQKEGKTAYKKAQELFSSPYPTIKARPQIDTTAFTSEKMDTPSKSYILLHSIKATVILFIAFVFSLSGFLFYLATRYYFQKDIIIMLALFTPGLIGALMSFKFRGNLRWDKQLLVLSWGTGFSLLCISYLFAILIGKASFSLTLITTARQLPPGTTPLIFLLLYLLYSNTWGVIKWGCINILSEIGWRGMMLDMLYTSLKNRALFLISFCWGIWYTFIATFIYNINISNSVDFGLIFLNCFIWGFCLNYLYLKKRNIISSLIFLGSLNPENFYILRNYVIIEKSLLTQEYGLIWIILGTLVLIMVKRWKAP